MKAHSLVVTRDYQSGEAIVQFRVAKECVKDLLTLFDKWRTQWKQSELAIEIKRWRDKRSLDANAYAWVLIGRIAEETRTAKADVYRRTIREIGGNYKQGCFLDADVDKLRECWESNGLGWVTDTLPSKLPGCTNVILYYGSHIYDTAQMARLIDLLIEDCKALGLEYLPTAEVERMLGQWQKA